MNPRVLLAAFAIATPAVVGFSPVATTIKNSLPTRQSSEVSSEGSPGIERRDVVRASLGSVAVAAGWKWQSESISSLPWVHSPRRPVLASVDEAVALIDDQCDRRFLYALVATDYRLLYRGVVGSRESNTPCMVQVKHRNSQTPLEAEFLTALGSPSLGYRTLVEDFSGDSPFHCTTTTDSMPIAMSFWPLGDNVHFGWPEREKDSLWFTSGESLSGHFIVDGVDCGVMALEDALKRSQGHVMVHANSFLLVPRSMEQELISKLKDSFII